MQTPREEHEAEHSRKAAHRWVPAELDESSALSKHQPRAVVARTPYFYCVNSGSSIITVQVLQHSSRTRQHARITKRNKRARSAGTRKSTWVVFINASEKALFPNTEAPQATTAFPNADRSSLLSIRTTLLPQFAISTLPVEVMATPMAQNGFPDGS